MNDELIGKRFGHLTVIKVYNRGGTVDCECDCGEIVNKRKADLVSGRITKCSRSCPTQYINNVIGGAKCVGYNKETKNLVLECPGCGEKFEANLTDATRTSIKKKRFCKKCKERYMNEVTENRTKHITDYYKDGRYLEKKPENLSDDFRGVNFDNAKQKWRAAIYVDKKRVYLGIYPTKFEAVQARLNAEEDYFGVPVDNELMARLEKQSRGVVQTASAAGKGMKI